MLNEAAHTSNILILAMQHAALDLLAKLTRVQQSRQEGKQRQARSQTLR